jgi:hypothetical protein
VIKLGEKLTDDAVTMCIKLIGRLFSQAHSRKKRRHMDHRTETSKALRLFLDTISALQSANDWGQDALEVVDQKVGWHRLLSAEGFEGRGRKRIALRLHCRSSAGSLGAGRKQNNACAQRQISNHKRGPL